MLEWLIEFLQKKQEEAAVRAEKKRRIKINRLMMELWRESAIFKCESESLEYLQKSDKDKGVKFRWFVDYTEEFLHR